MFARLLLLFITIPVLELALFMFLGSRIGIATTMAIIVITAFIGAYLTKSQGLKALGNYQQALAQGKLPHEEVMDGLMILIAGAVLLTPGFLTDAVGFALLVPSIRDIVKALVKTSLKDRVHIVGQNLDPGSQTHRSTSTSDPQVINVEAEVIDELTPSSSNQR